MSIDFEFYDQYRYVVHHSLWTALPRRNRLVAHLSDGADQSYCGRERNKAFGGSSLVAMHVTVAREIGAEDCKQCLKTRAAIERQTPSLVSS